MARALVAVELANAIDARAITVHAGFVPASVADDDPEVVGRVTSRLSQLQRASSCPIALENSELIASRSIKDLGSFATLRAVRRNSLRPLKFTIDIDSDDFVGDALMDDVGSFLIAEHRSIVDIHVHADDGLDDAKVSHLASTLKRVRYAQMLTVQSAASQVARNVTQLRQAFGPTNSKVHVA